MIKVNKALSIILGSIKGNSSQNTNITKALKRVLSEDIYANSNIPQFDNSAMDGFAVKSEDLKMASKNRSKTLEVIEDVKAGDIAKKTVKDNQAIRIMTGASIPKGADSVVMVEDTEKQLSDKKQKREYVKIFKGVSPGENIRKAGEDIKKGELVIRRGTQLEASHIGILASLGKSEVKVARKPKVAILATGDEVVDVDEKLTPGKLRSSNTYTLYSQVLNCGGLPHNLGIAKDRPQELKKKLTRGFGCDMIITSGGVSVGDYDFVKDVLARLGTEMKFWKVAMRPGKPLAFGTIKNKPVFGLPGNPVSSMISFEIFVRPAILKMSGQKEDRRNEVEAVVEEDIKKKKGFTYFLRANTYWKQGKYVTRTTGPQGSGILKSMALANSLIILSEKEEFIKKGSRVTVRFLD